MGDMRDVMETCLDARRQLTESAQRSVPALCADDIEALRAIRQSAIFEEVARTPDYHSFRGAIIALTPTPVAEAHKRAQKLARLCEQGRITKDFAIARDLLEAAADPMAPDGGKSLGSYPDNDEDSPRSDTDGGASQKKDGHGDQSGTADQGYIDERDDENRVAVSEVDDDPKDIDLDPVGDLGERARWVEAHLLLSEDDHDKKGDDESKDEAAQLRSENARLRARLSEYEKHPPGAAPTPDYSKVKRSPDDGGDIDKGDGPIGEAGYGKKDHDKDDEYAEADHYGSGSAAGDDDDDETKRRLKKGESKDWKPSAETPGDGDQGSAGASPSDDDERDTVREGKDWKPSAETPGDGDQGSAGASPTATGEVGDDGKKQNEALTAHERAAVAYLEKSGIRPGDRQFTEMFVRYCRNIPSRR